MLSPIKRSEWYNELKMLDLIEKYDCCSVFTDRKIEKHCDEDIYFCGNITYVSSSSSLKDMVGTSVYYGKVRIIPSGFNHMIYITSNLQ